MDLVFCTEARLVRRSSGLVYSIDGGLTNNLWQRYLCKFNHVYVMARVLSDDDCPINDKYLASVSYTHLRAHETGRNLVCRLLLEKKKTKQQRKTQKKKEKK